MRAFVTVIIRHENGPCRLPGGCWYGEPLITEGFTLVGLERAVHGY